MCFEDLGLQFGQLLGRVSVPGAKIPFGMGTVGFSLASFASVGPALGSLGAASTPLPARLPFDIGAELYRSIFHGQIRWTISVSRSRASLGCIIGRSWM